MIGHHKDGAVFDYIGRIGGLRLSEIKLLALDLDGTLFTKDKQVTAEIELL